MSESTENLKATARFDTEFFTVGQPLNAVRAGYVVREADKELHQAIVSGQDACLFAPMRSGKTSLIAATSARLRNNGFDVANLDLAQIGERDAGTDAGRWYYSIAYRLVRQLRLKVDLQSWWQDKSILASRQRLFEFYAEVVLANTRDRVVVFIDELHSVSDVTIVHQLVESITAVNKARATEPEFARLTFVLAGECDPQDIAPDPELSPFSVMRRIQLANFSRESLRSFEPELNLPQAFAAAALDRVHYWTRGQPYLTQKLSRLIARDGVGDDPVEGVDRIVSTQFGHPGSLRNERHLSHIHRRIVEDKRSFEAALTTYGKLRKGIDVPYEPEIAAQRLLITVGLVVPRRSGKLGVANPLYALAFTARWANDHLPLRWRGPALAAGALLLISAVPFWYTQMLPKPYARLLTSPQVDLDTAAETYRNLRSFPGHAETADRLFVYYLQNISASATSPGEMAAIALRAAEVPDQEGLAPALLGDFWARQAERAMRREDRDASLIATVQSLAEPTTERRRTIGSLIGRDYPLLIGTVNASGPGEVAFDTGNKILTVTDGSAVRQWQVQAGRLEPRAQWTMSALGITPLLRRQSVTGAGPVSSISLALEVEHGRREDLRVRLVSPSGRAAELGFADGGSTTGEVTQFTGHVLSGLLGEAAAGTWTLSLRDEAIGFPGRLLSWQLRINGQAVQESAESGLEIPEPAERQPDSVWTSADGRFAIARAEQSDSARLWHLAYASPTQTLAIPASERVLGLTSDASMVVTVGRGVIHSWRVADGRRISSIDIGSVQEARLLPRQDRVLLRRPSDAGTRFELWNLDGRRAAAAIEIGGDAALASVDAAGGSLAVADYERAVRVWNLESGEQLAQFDLPLQPSAMELSPDGRSVAMRYGEQSFALWRVTQPDAPVFARSSDDRWSFAFSASGAWLLAGSGSSGFRIVRTNDGRAIGPPLDAGPSNGEARLLSFSDDSNVVLTATAMGQARFWRFPTAATARAPDDAGLDNSGWWWRDEENIVAALAPDGRFAAVGDAEGHVHVFSRVGPRPDDAEAVNYFGHRHAVASLAFSADGRSAASAGVDGRIRVWDAATGRPRQFAGEPQGARVDVMRFSPTARYLAALLGQRLWMMDTTDGSVVVDLDLGETHRDIAFAADDRLYVAGSSGALRVLATDTLNNWTLQDFWHGPHPLQRLGLSPSGTTLLLVDARNVVQALDLGNARLGTARLDLPDRVHDILFVNGNTEVILRTSRWLHRAVISASGLHWQAAARTPLGIVGANAVLDRQAVDVAGPTVLMLTRDAGITEVAAIDFARNHAAPVFGTREELLDYWRPRVRDGSAVNRPDPAP